jgi:hypothetical protein
VRGCGPLQEEAVLLVQLHQVLRSAVCMYGQAYSDTGRFAKSAQVQPEVGRARWWWWVGGSGLHVGNGRRGARGDRPSSSDMVLGRG